MKTEEISIMPKCACMTLCIASLLVKTDVFLTCWQRLFRLPLLNIYYDSYISRVFKLFIYKKAIFIR